MRCRHSDSCTTLLFKLSQIGETSCLSPMIIKLKLKNCMQSGCEDDYKLDSCATVCDVAIAQVRMISQ